MKIDGGAEQLSKLHASEFRTIAHQEPPKDRSQGIRRTDQVTLSSMAQELKQLYQTLSSLPAERGQRVMALREAIKSGNYQIPEDELIERLMGVVCPER